MPETTNDACRGRVALVTSASRGIGAALARRLAAEGAAVAVTARTLEQTARLPMRARRRGWILNISSTTDAIPEGPPFAPFARSGGALVYGMRKAALDRLSVGLAAEVHDDGIAVNALSPVAAVRTPVTGRVAYSRPLLEELGRTPRTLDGRHAYDEVRSGGGR